VVLSQARDHRANRDNAASPKISKLYTIRQPPPHANSITIYSVNPVPNESAEEPTRRRFYVGAIYAMMAAITAAIGLPAAAYLLVPGKPRKKEDWIEAGDMTRLTPNVPVELAFRRTRIDGWKTISEKGTAWAVKTGDNQVVAYGPQCTHLGCAYHWEQNANQFFCPCHNSVFALDGKVVAGPAPRPLDRYDTRIEGTKVLIGKLHKSTEEG
jgi:menaquinol-cytochrome c reductase iron-sulfur subunit